eukprot:4505107-Pyramimonas_sp.AAC.1
MGPGRQGSPYELHCSLYGVFTALLLAMMTCEARCHERQGCANNPADWTDSRGLPCDDYEDLCTTSADQVMNRHFVIGYPSDVGSMGHSAVEACCICGGGREIHVATSMISNTTPAIASITSIATKSVKGRRLLASTTVT